jgi:hypothetical protein
MFDNGMLKRIFGLKRKQVKGEWRKLHTQYSSPNNIRVIKLKRMG